MRKMIFLTVMGFVMFSCGVEEVSRRPQTGTGDVWVRPGVDVDSVAAGDAAVYLTAVEYPAGYDWRADSERGEVKCSLVVYADGAPLIKVPVGERYEVSSDPETHRIENGHLYTDFCSDGETVVKRDGVEIMRFAGREMICDLVEYGNEVYTLGHDRDGGGFSFRRNGRAVLTRRNGASFEKIHVGKDSLSFAFREPIGSEDGGYERYYHVLNGNVSQAAIRDDIIKVWDIVPYRGGLCYLASVVGVPSPVLFTLEGMRALSLSRVCDVLDCRLIVEDGVLFVEGIIERPGMENTGAIWYSDGRTHIFATGLTVSSICVDGYGANCLLNPVPPYSQGVIYRAGEHLPMPEGYFSAGSRTCAMVKGIFHAGLSSQSCGYPLVWKDGAVDTLRINGFISGVSGNKW